MSDDPLDECPICMGSVRRVINSVGVVFKGQGFYVTDNRRSTTLPSTSGAGEANAGKSESATSDTTSSSKPETTTPAKSPSSESAPA